MVQSTKRMTAEEIVQFATTQIGLPWHWGIFLHREKCEAFAAENDLQVMWDVPVMPGDLYLAKRNTGFQLLTCERLGEACVWPKEHAYFYDFSECVKVTEAPHGSPATEFSGEVPETVDIFRSRLIEALVTAIGYQTDQDAAHRLWDDNTGPSTVLRDWQTILDALKDGKQIRVRG